MEVHSFTQHLGTEPEPEVGWWKLPVELLLSVILGYPNDNKHAFAGIEKLIEKVVSSTVVLYQVMAMLDVPNGIVLFQYQQSPYCRRICWYLALRGISYAESVRANHILYVMVSIH